jgi:hypothetical protein
MLTAAVAGTIFASPSTKQILTGLRAIRSAAGTLVIVKNYTGDVLHFGLAVERAKVEGFKVEMVVVADDVAVGREKGSLVGRRGLAGTILVHKITGALAEAGYAPFDILSFMQVGIDELGSRSKRLLGLPRVSLKILSPLDSRWITVLSLAELPRDFFLRTKLRLEWEYIMNRVFSVSRQFQLPQNLLPNCSNCSSINLIQIVHSSHSVQEMRLFS